MKKISDFLVSKRIYILCTMLVLVIVSTFLISKVNVNYDLTKYLPAESKTKQGLNIMADEFPGGDVSSFNLIFSGLVETKKDTIYDELRNTTGVSSVNYDKISPEYNKDNNTLYAINIKAAADSELAETVFDEITQKYEADYSISTNGEVTEIYKNMLSPIVMFFAFLVMLVILIIMSDSWLDPLLFFVTIGAAVILNMGSNVIFESVSSKTNSITAILQVVLSIDYAIIIIRRYRQERGKHERNTTAMKESLRKGFGSVFGSSLTTSVGLLCLVFMSFTIGKDMGLVLAKGVILSLLCVFTILPTLILWFDRFYTKTKKRTLNLNFKRLGTFSYKYRNYILAVFLLIFVGCFYLRGNVEISYTLSHSDEISEAFNTTNTIVVVYNNNQADQAAELVSKLQKKENVKDINAYANTLGIKLSAGELAAQTQMDESLVEQAFGYYFMKNGQSENNKISLYDFISFVANDMATNKQFEPYFTAETKAQLDGALSTMDSALSQLVGNNYSRMIIKTTLDLESPQTTDFINEIKATLPNDSYLIGDSAMADDMSQTFRGEANYITIITAVAIFLIIAIIFRSVIIPILLVLIIQTSVFVLMGLTSVLSNNIYFLALLIVQCILMGATIDYAIIYTSYFRESREKLSLKDAIIRAYNKSYHTILTSSLILIAITFIVGQAFADESIRNICLTIAEGTICALLLILFFLPGIIAATDKLISKEKNEDKNK